MYATYNTIDGNKSSSVFTTKDLAQAVADKQNVKAKNLGIKATYEVKEASNDDLPAGSQPLDKLPSVWS